MKSTETNINANAPIGQTPWSMFTRPEEAYAATYIAHEMRVRGVGAMSDDFLKGISLGNSVVFKLLEDTKRTIDRNGGVEELLDRLSSFTDNELICILSLSPFNETSGSEGQYVTPRGVCLLVQAILEPKPDDFVADFCSGTGEFLQMVNGMSPNCNLSGIELNPWVFSVAAIRNASSGSNISYTLSDVLSYEFEGRYDKVFVNGPWGMRTRGIESSDHVISDIINNKGLFKCPVSADWLFAFKAIQSLKENGTAVVVVTNGATFNSRDSGARRFFIENGYIEAAITMPEGLFAPYSGIGTAILILSRNKTVDKVRLVDARDLGIKERRTVTIGSDAIESVLERLNNDGDCSRTVSLKELAQNGWDLYAPTYTEKAPEVPNPVEFGTVIAKITRGAAMSASEFDSLFTEETTSIRYLNHSSIVKGIIDLNLPHLTELDPKYGKYCVHEGDLVISKNGAPFKAAVVSSIEGDKVLANANLYVIKLKPGCNPYYLAAFFNSEIGQLALTRIARGTTLKTIGASDLKKLIVPNEDKERQGAVADSYRDALASVQRLSAELDLAIEKAGRAFTDSEVARP